MCEDQVRGLDMSYSLWGGGRGLPERREGSGVESGERTRMRRGEEISSGCGWSMIGIII